MPTEQLTPEPQAKKTTNRAPKRANDPTREDWSIFRDVFTPRANEGGRAVNPYQKFVDMASNTPVEPSEAVKTLRALLAAAHAFRGRQLVLMTMTSDRAADGAFRAFVAEMAGDMQNLTTTAALRGKQRAVSMAFESGIDYILTKWENLDPTGRKSVARKDKYRELGVTTNEVIGSWLPEESGVIPYLRTRTIAHIFKAYFAQRSLDHERRKTRQSFEQLGEKGVDFSSEGQIVRRMTTAHEDVALALGDDVEQVDDKVISADEAESDYASNLLALPTPADFMSFKYHEDIEKPKVANDVEGPGVAAGEDVQQSSEFKKAVHRNYKALEIDTDAIKHPVVATATMINERFFKLLASLPPEHIESPSFDNEAILQEALKQVVATYKAAPGASGALWPLSLYLGTMDGVGKMGIEELKKETRRFFNDISVIDAEIVRDNQLSEINDLIDSWDGRTPLNKYMPEIAVCMERHLERMTRVVPDPRLAALEVQRELWNAEETDAPEAKKSPSPAANLEGMDSIYAPPEIPLTKGAAAIHQAVASSTTNFELMYNQTDSKAYDLESPTRPDYIFLCEKLREQPDPHLRGNALIRKLKEYAQVWKKILIGADQSSNVAIATAIVALQSWDPLEELLGGQFEMALKKLFAKDFAEPCLSAVGTNDIQSTPNADALEKAIEEKKPGPHKGGKEKRTGDQSTFGF